MIENLYSFYRSRCERYADCMLFDNHITYSQAFDMAMARAHFLQKKGIREGDVVALLAPGSAEWCLAYMAITIIGAVVLPLDVNLPAVDYASMLKKVKAKAAFATKDLRKKLPKLPVFELGPGRSTGDAGRAKPALVRESHVASLVFTSGTTGNPKIVTLTHRNIFRTAISTSEYLRLGPGDMNLCILPLFHVYALDANFIGPFAAGGALVFQPSLKGPDIMKSLADNPITIFPAAPQLWELFMDAIINRVKSQSAAKYRVFMFFMKTAPLFRAIGLSFLPRTVFKPVRDIFGPSHRFFISGGAPLKRKYARYYRNAGLTLIEGYGLTETTGPITLPDPLRNTIGSVGKPTPGNEVLIKNVNRDGVGEVWLRGDSVMAGYYKNERANAEVFNSAGFFNTGDLGRLDRRGNIILTGRSRNVIVLDSGKNVYPEELESYYRASPLIAEIAVFGRRIEGRERAYAVIVPSFRGGNAYDRIRSEMQKMNLMLPAYRAVRQFAVSLDPLPVNTTRKILYREIIDNLERGLYQTGPDDSVVLRQELAGASQREELIVAAMRRALNRKTLFTNQTLADLGIDSLGAIELIVRMEDELGVTIDAGRVMKLETLGELVLYIASIPEGREHTLEDRIFRGEITTRAHRFFNPLPHLILGLLRTISSLCWQLNTAHPERLSVDNSIIIANHESYLDIIWMASQLPAKYRENIYITGKKKFSFLRYVFPVLPVIFIEQENSLPALKASADILRQGKSLVIFPEGTRSRTGRLGEFKTGAAYLAKNLGVKIIPVSINGSWEVFPPGSFLPDFFGGKKGSIVIGDPVDPAKYSSVEQMTCAMRAAVAANLDGEEATEKAAGKRRVSRRKKI
jgi:long-chain acyl-CoA synthetase